MAELLIVQKSHWTNEKTKAQIDSNDELLKSYLSKIVPGAVVEVREDGWFATPANPLGRGWYGDGFWLIKVPGSTAEHAAHNLKKLITVTGWTKQAEIFDEVIDMTKIMVEAVQEVWTGSIPGSGTFARYIYTLDDKLKIKSRKVVYDKTDKIEIKTVKDDATVETAKVAKK
jgi:hypothetical protein